MTTDDNIKRAKACGGTVYSGQVTLTVRELDAYTTKVTSEAQAAIAQPVGLSGVAWSVVTGRCFDTGGTRACADVPESRCTVCPNRAAIAQPQRSSMTTQDVICNFLAVLKDTGHKPEDVKAALLLFSGAAIAQPKQQIKPVAWFEYSQDLDAWFLSYGYNPKAKTRPLFEHPAIEQPTSGEYAMGYAEGFNDACKPAKPKEPS